jgi:multidrug efflux system outer membrane protein
MVAVMLGVAPAGCAVGPDYKRPDTPAGKQESFRGQAAEAKSLGDLPFWEVFHDEALKGLIQEALSKSPSVQVAAARVEQARGLARADGWALAPSLTANAVGMRQRAPVGPGVIATFNTFTPSIAASWEIDLWGRLRRTQEASYQAFMASEEAQRGVMVALVGDVAQAYFLLRALDAQRAIAEQRIASRTKALQLFQARLDRGTGNRAEVATATAQVMDARAQLADIERRRRVAENQLSVLTGSPPRQLPRGATLEAQVMPPVPAGLPSALLERRPDLRQAEAQLHAETARVGAAQANLFPKLSLTAALGLASPALGTLASAQAATWSFGGALNWLAPFLGREQLMAAVDIQKGRAAEVGAQYFAVVLNALREVDDALSALELVGQQVEAIEAQVKAVMEQRTLAESRYQSGVTSFLEVTTAEEAVLPAQLSLENARAARLTALVSLYRALGGGWKVPETR